jgi:uncharacterized peroxidase-related enzyme
MFLREPPPSPRRQRLYDEDIEEMGYVMNLTRAWAWEPDLTGELFGLMKTAVRAADLTYRERALLVVAAAAGLGDSYCALVWGARLADASDIATAVGVVADDTTMLDTRERALTAWARQVARDPSATTASGVETLRDGGFDDRQILALTTFVAARVAFATVNDALGARPDAQLVRRGPAELVQAIDFGRPPLADGD